MVLKHLADGVKRINGRQIFLVLLLLCWPSFLGFGPPALVESDDLELPVGKAQLRALSLAKTPTMAVRASLIMDISTGRVVFQRNAHARSAPASITKVMTAVIVLESARLEEKVTVLQEDVLEGSSMGLQPGDTLKVEQLLWGLLIPSGNDAAHALARHVGRGSVARFVEMMNEKAQALGLQDTHFANPHGLDQPNHYSSAYDLARLSRYVLRNPLFAKIVATREYTVQASRTFELWNTNELLFMSSDVPGVDGVKTGFTEQAGGSLVASAERDGHEVLTVVLGAPDRATASADLVEFGYTHFTWVPLPLPHSLRGNPQGSLSPAGRVEVMVPRWQRYYVKFFIHVGEVPQKGALFGPVGVLIYYLAGQELGRLPLYVQQR